MDKLQDQKESEEINLRDYINVIIRRKKIILTVFFLSVITAVIFSLNEPKVYLAASSIMIVPSEIRVVFTPTSDLLPTQPKTGTDEYSGQRFSFSLSTHKELLKSNMVLERVINNLGLKEISGKNFDPERLSKKLNIKETTGTSILQLEAEDADPKKAEKLANAWAQEYINYSREFISGEVKGKGDFIADQFEISRQNLVSAEKKVNDFKDEYKLDLMRAELNIKNDKLNDYKTELINSEMVLKTKEYSLAELKKEIAKQDKFTIVSKAITDDALWQKSIQKENSSDLDKKKLRSEEVNPIYQDLATRIVNTEIDLNTLTQKVDSLRKSQDKIGTEIDLLAKNINQNEFELTQLTRQVEIYKRTYYSLSTKIEEARIAKSAQLGEVKLISPALEPRYPIRPNKRQKVAIGGILGLMSGIILAFFMEYWQYSKRIQRKNG